jgi:hypothetical protein
VPTKMLVCLANSYKGGERCVAGVEIGDGSHRWVRPVSNRSGHGVSTGERQYPGGIEPQVLDIIFVPLLAHRPHGFQRENWLLDPTIRWRKAGRFGWGELGTLEDHPESLWVNGNSTTHGINDRVPNVATQPVSDSLKLIQVDRVTIQVQSDPWSPGGHPSVRAQFAYAGAVYTLKVTDPDYKASFQAKGVGNHKLGKSFLTISLSEEYDDGASYKVVAAIIESPGPNTKIER